MTYHDRRTFLRAVGLGTTGALASNYATGAVAAATTITIEGGGYDIWNARDEFHYYYTEVDGDFDVRVKVDSLEDTDPWARAGLMVRQTLNDDAEHAMIRKTPGNETSFQWRSDDGSDAQSTTSGGTGEAETSGGTVSATWQRLVRSGDTIEAYGSNDGSNWTLIADISPGEIDLADSAYVGLAVCSHNEGTLCTAQFSNLSGLSPGSNEDVGNVEVAGSVSTSSGGGSDTDPVVSTGSASNVGTSSATFSGALDNLGGASSADVGFEYRQSGSSSWTATSTQTLSSTGSVSADVSGLSAGTDYEFRATATASDGDTATGSTNTFSTSTSDTAPVVSTGSASNVGTSSATLEGSLDSLGGASSADVSFEWRESGASSWTATASQTRSSTDGFSESVSGLSAGTDYEFRALATASDGDSATASANAFTTSTDGGGGSSGGAYFDLSDGFASPSWFDDSVDVYRVQNATRSELANAVQGSGPRLVVFETSGTIDLGGSELEVTADQCWIAGQTAPSPGITLTQGLFQVNANDVVVQHLRSRVGPGDSGSIQGNDSFNSADGTQNVIFDHCTASWGVDECMSVGYDTNNTTFSNCLIYEGLYDPYGDGSDHNYCTLVGDGSDHVALLGNVWAKARSRIPRLKSDTRSVVANNFCYFFDEAANVDSSAETTWVGNKYTGLTATGESIIEGSGTVYTEDNTTADPPLDSDVSFAEQSTTGSRPLWPSGLSAMPSGDVESHNLSYAGARPADRTSNDSRIISEIRNRAGNDRLDSPYDYWIADHEEVGGYPQLPENTHSLNVPSSGLREWLDQWALSVEDPNASPP